MPSIIQVLLPLLIFPNVLLYIAVTPEVSDLVAAKQLGGGSSRFMHQSEKKMIFYLVLVHGIPIITDMLKVSSQAATSNW